MTAMDVSRYLERTIAKAGNNKSGIAKTAGISRSTLYRILRGNLEDVKIITILKLAMALKVDVRDIVTLYFQEGRVQNREGRLK